MRNIQIIGIILIVLATAGWGGWKQDGSFSTIVADTAIYDTGIKSTSGSVTVCADTKGKFVTSSTACTGIK